MERKDVNYDELSPMMQQYMDIKAEHENELLFYRVGDFYELFFEDGITASRALELTLTGKNAGLKERVPMCGVPYHSVKPYIEKLIDQGFKVAICEQLEDPKTTNKMVKRGVIQVISKGTLTDLEMISPKDTNYIASILDYGSSYIITYADISTGEVNSLELSHDKKKLINEILNLNIKEVILNDFDDAEFTSTLKDTYNIEISLSTNLLSEGYEYLYTDLNDKQISGIKHLFYYITITNMKDLSHVEKVNIINKEEYLEMDIHTQRNLELFETLRLKDRTYSLIWLLDKCKTAMGSRKLKSYIQNPLKDIKELNKRYDMIEKLSTEFIIRDELRNNLYEVYDLGRLCGKLVGGSINARDLLQIKNSLKVIPSIKKSVKDLKFDYEIDDFSKMYNLLEESIYEDAPTTLKEGYLIKSGYNKELDELKSIRSGGKDFISKFEKEIQETTGLKNIKVGYNKVFGYYIEVSKAQSKQVKEEFGWERRQTLTNAERYISPELKEQEAIVLNAEDKIIELEYNLFIEIKEELKKDVFKLKKLAEVLADLDSVCALSIDADELNLIRPKLTTDNVIRIIQGRHPVVEAVSNNSYVANDCIMDENVSTLLITGPNMSGKSTYMRQLAIIIIMAQMGSFVPASEATLPIIDKIFTRIGASDDLVSGESTFMVEMKEAKNAICNATKNSLILFDELGRGTATYDGMSLAQAILEYVTKKIKCKTLFSTHYHELTSLEQDIKEIKNIHVSAYEDNGNVVFLHKIEDGPVDKSYGIHVARLANMPEELLSRAQNILKVYESHDTMNNNFNVSKQVAFNFDEEVIQEDETSKKLKEYLDKIEINNLRPIDAINVLDELIKIKNNK